MSRHTTFRIGGPAELFLVPKSTEEIAGIFKICREEGIPWFVLGNGSNLLVSDKGYQGVVIQLYKGFGEVKVQGCQITAQAGALLSQIAAAAREESLTGFEFAGGIPGARRGVLSSLFHRRGRRQGPRHAAEAMENRRPAKRGD